MFKHEYCINSSEYRFMYNMFCRDLKSTFSNCVAIYILTKVYNISLTAIQKELGNSYSLASLSRKRKMFEEFKAGNPKMFLKLLKAYKPVIYEQCKYIFLEGK